MDRSELLAQPFAARNYAEVPVCGSLVGESSAAAAVVVPHIVEIVEVEGVDLRHSISDVVVEVARTRPWGPVLACR